MGYARGFETLGEETRIEALPVAGEIPGWLGGSLIRTGPARFEVGGRGMAHWFDGFAMLHRFGFGQGAVSYASRYLEGKAYQAAEETGEIAYSEFATDPCRSLFKRAMSLFQPALSDNCNVNLVQLGARFVAMTETPIPVEFDAATLAAAGVAWEVPGQLTTAHPHLDRSTGGMLNYAARLGPRNSYRFFRLGTGPGAKPEVVASVPARRPAYMHSFGLTERWFVLAEFPFVVNPAALALSGRPYIENYRWRPELGTRFTLVDRAGGETLGPFTAAPCFGFHHVNAFEDGDGSVVADICTFEDAAIVTRLYLDELRAGRGIPAPALRRFTIDPDAGSVTDERLVDEPLDLPRIDYGRCSGRPYRYVWGAGTDGTGFFDRIVRVDLEDRSTLTWSEPDCWPGEPVFVARPDAGGEGEGVLLSVVLDGAAGSSFLLVLDAETLAEVGRATVPHHIPFGFHGQYAAAA
jgi:carotenoid cleavage dioxygenase-like enzyme